MMYIDCRKNKGGVAIAQDTIRKEVTGQQIINAVKAIAGPRVYAKQDYVDGEDVFILGQTSSYPYEHLIVTADGNKNINPTKTYGAITVEEYRWGGPIYAIGYNQEDVIRAVKDFTQRLRQHFQIT